MTRIHTHMNLMRNMTKSERKKYRRSERQREAAAMQTIPLDKERHLRVTIIVRRKHDPEWRTLSRLSDINYRLSCQSISESIAHDLAQRVAARWQAQDMFQEIRVHWRYGRREVDRRGETFHTEHAPKAEKVSRKAALHPATAKALASIEALFA